MAKVSGIIRDSKLESRQDGDTIRLWENYRDQASMWRAISLLQIPATAAALIFAAVMFSQRSITLNVPAKPLPGVYAVQEINDSEFVNVASEFVNLVSTFQAKIARRQFEAARESLMEPMLTYFNSEMMVNELKAIETTGRTQLFFVDPTKTAVSREGKNVSVTFEGDRTKLIAGRESPLQKAKYTVTMTTIPRNKLNPYGIVITNVQHELLK